MPSHGKFSHLLAKVNFPLYTVQVLTERHILVAGGGGASKTGIPNIIEIYELINDGRTCRSESLFNYETGRAAIMNSAVYNTGKYCILFAGMEEECQLYKIKYDICEKDADSDSELTNDESANLRNRFQNKSVSAQQTSKTFYNNYKSPTSCLCFAIQPLCSFQTDFSYEPFQKLVKFSSIRNVLATAGTDGHIRLWKYPEMNLVQDIQAHDNDVDDIDICPQGVMIVSVSRDGHGKVWNMEDGMLISHLSYTLPLKSPAKYIFKSCKFGATQQSKSQHLYATLNPSVRVKPPSPSFLCKWNSETFVMKQITAVGTELLSAFAISENGLCLGLGTQEGSVKLYVASNLKLLYSVDHAHKIFVTGLEFLQASDASCRITGGHGTSLISISVDNQINIHHVPVKDRMGMLNLITYCVFILLFIFILMDYCNL